jgi:hypothetical protein
MLFKIKKQILVFQVLWLVNGNPRAWTQARFLIQLQFIPLDHSVSLKNLICCYLKESLFQNTLIPITTFLQSILSGKSWTFCISGDYHFIPVSNQTLYLHVVYLIIFCYHIRLRVWTWIETFKWAEYFGIERNGDFSKDCWLNRELKRKT